MPSPWLYAMPLAFVGFFAAQVLMQGAYRAKPPHKQQVGRAIILRVLPASNLLFAFVVSLLAQGRPEVDLSLRLLVLGSVACLASIAQGILLRWRWPGVTTDESFGRAVSWIVVPEVATVLAFMWAFLGLGGAA